MYISSGMKLRGTINAICDTLQPYDRCERRLLRIKQMDDYISVSGLDSYNRTADKLWVRSNSSAPGILLSKQLEVGQNPVFEVKWEVKDTSLKLHDRPLRDLSTVRVLYG
jgi:hypothetical protein